jgi:hypothetical protein
LGVAPLAVLLYDVSDGSTRGGIQMEEIGQELPLLEVSREARLLRGRRATVKSSAPEV